MTSHADCIGHALAQIRPASLAKAMEALLSGTYIITLTRQSDREVGATVQRDGAQYTVTLTPTGGFCSCPDSLLRYKKCAHIAMTALTLCQHPPAAHPKPVTHLRWSDGRILCGLNDGTAHASLVWPWPMNIVHHPHQWPEVVLCEACRTAYLQPRAPLRAVA